jgi:hypothetical protein
MKDVQFSELFRAHILPFPPHFKRTSKQLSAPPRTHTKVLSVFVDLLIQFPAEVTAVHLSIWHELHNSSNDVQNGQFFVLLFDYIYRHVQSQESRYGAFRNLIESVPDENTFPKTK